MPFGPPRIDALKNQLSALRGDSPASVAEPLGVLEQFGATALGASLAGVARRTGMSDAVLALSSLATGLYGATSGQRFVSNLALGALAPLMADWAGRNISFGKAEDNEDEDEEAPRSKRKNPAPRVVNSH